MQPTPPSVPPPTGDRSFRSRQDVEAQVVGGGMWPMFDGHHNWPNWNGHAPQWNGNHNHNQQAASNWNSSQKLDSVHRDFGHRRTKNRIWQVKKKHRTDIS